MRKRKIVIAVAFAATIFAGIAIGMVAQEDYLQVETRYGVANIPVSKIIRIEPGETADTKVPMIIIDLADGQRFVGRIARPSPEIWWR